MSEVWKALNIEGYPLKLEKQKINEEGVSTRAATTGKLCMVGRSVLAKKTCISDAIRLWNGAPPAVTISESLYRAKKEIKKYVKTLPI